MTVQEKCRQKKAVLYQYAVAGIVGLSSMTFGAWLTWPSTALTALSDGSQNIILTTVQKSTVVAMMDIGNCVSPVPTGYIMNWLGRKFAILLSGVLYFVASIFVLTASEVWHLYVARLFAGMAKGVGYVVVPVYLAEVAQVDIRGGLNTVFTASISLGVVVESLLATRFSYETINYVNLLMPSIFMLLMVFVPESPYFYMMKGRDKLATTSLAKYRWLSKDSESERSLLDEELKTVKDSVNKDIGKRSNWTNVLKSSANKRALWIIAPLAMFNRLCGISAAVAYGPIILPEGGGGMSVSYYMTLFGVILIVGTFTSNPLVDRIGRKPLMLISSWGSALVQGIAALYYYCDKTNYIDTSYIKWIPYVSFVTFAVTFSLGIGFIPSLLVAELFPTDLKGYAGSIATFVLAFTSIGVHKAFLSVSETYGVHVMFAVFSLSCVICGFFTSVFVFETKCKTFSEIQDILNRTDSTNEFELKKLKEDQNV